MNKLMAWLMPKAHAFAQFMGRGKRKVIVLYLWPFTTLAVFGLLLLGYDTFIR